MPHGAADYWGTGIVNESGWSYVTAEALAVDVVAQTIGDLKVDIDAQSLAKVQVNIASQTAALDINIAASAITLNVAIQSSAVTLNVNLSSQSAFNLNVNLAASAVTLNVAITSAITLNVNISSQTAALTVALVASSIVLGVNISSITGGVTFNVGTVSGTVNVNLAASGITLNVNLKSSSITLNVNISSITGGVTFNIGTISGTVNIKIASAQAVGVWIQSEWAAKTGNQKSGAAGDNNLSRGGVVVFAYTIPSGKTFYVTSWGGAICASEAANADQFQICDGLLWNDSTGATLARTGGNGGFHTTFPTPLVVPSGQVLKAQICNNSNHTTNMVVSIAGFEA